MWYNRGRNRAGPLRAGGGTAYERDYGSVDETQIRAGVRAEGHPRRGEGGHPGGGHAGPHRGELHALLHPGHHRPGPEGQAGGDLRPPALYRRGPHGVGISGGLPPLGAEIPAGRVRKCARAPAQRPDSGHQRHGDRRPRRLRGRREPGGGLLLHRGHY